MIASAAANESHRRPAPNSSAGVVDTIEIVSGGWRIDSRYCADSTLTSASTVARLWPGRRRPAMFTQHEVSSVMTPAAGVWLNRVADDRLAITPSGLPPPRPLNSPAVTPATTIGTSPIHARRVVTAADR